jgi:hypothetical protein
MVSLHITEKVDVGYIALSLDDTSPVGLITTLPFSSQMITQLTDAITTISQSQTFRPSPRQIMSPTFVI